MYKKLIKNMHIIKNVEKSNTRELHWVVNTDLFENLVFGSRYYGP